jgi:four helix bundle suffix protein
MYFCKEFSEKIMMDKDKDKDIPKVLQNEVQYQDLFFYQKSEVLYALTYHFAKRFLSAKADRTVDQMIQAARSGKQNIVEGFADGMTSTELQLKLLNVARSSLKELRADYEDYLTTRHLTVWDGGNPRYDTLLKFCRQHNKVSDYEPFFDRWGDEEQCNVALTLLHMTDKMMKTYLSGLDKQFVTQGGIKERMHAARTGYRKGIDEELQRLREENKGLRQQVPILEQRIEQLLNEKRHLEVLLQQARKRD